MKKIIGFCAFLVIWVAGVFLVEVVFEIKDTTWVMFFGYLIGAFGFFVNDEIAP